MTLRDLPRRGISTATITDAPTVSASVGTWTTGGLSDFIDDEHFEALKRMSGLTVDPDIASDVLHVNGRAHVVEQIDNNLV